MDTWGVAALFGTGNYISVTGYNSNITASRTNFGGGGGYQWVWENGFNILTALGLEKSHILQLMKNIHQMNLKSTKII